MIALLKAPAQLQIPLQSSAAESFQETTRHQRTPHPIWATEEIGRRKALQLQCCRKQLHRLWLAQNPRK